MNISFFLSSNFVVKNPQFKMNKYDLQCRE